MKAVKIHDKSGLYKIEMTLCAKHHHHHTLRSCVFLLVCLGMFSFHQKVIKALNARQQHELCEPELISYSNNIFLQQGIVMSHS